MSQLYPQQVILDEQGLQRLNTLYKSAYKQIISELEGATGFGTAHRKAILAQIEEILIEMGEDVNPLIDDEIRRAYGIGAEMSVDQLKKVDADIPVSTGFNRIHKQAIQALVDESQEAFATSITGVARTARVMLGKAVRDQLTQQMAIGKIQGEALREIKKALVSTLKDEGLAALTDKAGRTWSLDRYTEMLIRTKTVEARNRGLANRTVENGYDLVQVSAHGASDVCAGWEGKVLSLTGQEDDFPTVAEAEADGLFHPNCKHAINILVPALAEMTKAYDPETATFPVDDDTAIEELKRVA